MHVLLESGFIQTGLMASCSISFFHFDDEPSSQNSCDQFLKTYTTAVPFLDTSLVQNMLV
jgi:hypothetical protein